MQKDENKKKSELIEKLQKGQESMRKEIEKELKEKILEQAILRHEKEMQAIYQKKEDELKVTFSEKVFTRTLYNNLEDDSYRKNYFCLVC